MSSFSVCKTTVAHNDAIGKKDPTKSKSLTIAEFDRIEQMIKVALGSEKPTQAHYIEAAESLLKIEQKKLDKLLGDKPVAKESPVTPPTSVEPTKPTPEKAVTAEVGTAAEMSEKEQQELIDAVEVAKTDEESDAAMDRYYAASISDQDTPLLDAHYLENKKVASFVSDYKSAETRDSGRYRESRGNGLSTGKTESTNSSITKTTLDAIAAALVSGNYRSASGGKTGVMTTQAVNKTAQSVANKVPGKPVVEVFANPAAAGIPVPAGIEPKGVTLPDGRVLVFSDYATSSMDVIQTVFHELVHRGLKAHFTSNKQYVAFMLDMAKRHPALAASANAWKATKDGKEKYAEFSARRPMTGDNLANYEAIAVEETLAQLGESTRGGSMGSSKTWVRKVAKIFADIAAALNLRELSQWLNRATYSEAEQFANEMINKSAQKSNIGTTALYRSSPREDAKTLGPQIEEVALRYGGASARVVAANTTGVVKKLVSATRFLHDLVDSAKKTLPAASEWYKAMNQLANARNQMEKNAEVIADTAIKLKGGTSAVNAFIAKSTFGQKWGYAPEFRKDVVVDPAMKAAFDALSTEEQSLVKAVFAHGEEMASKRQALLMSLGIDGMFGKGISKLDGPYAPLKRFGNYWAELKSQELLDAEKAGDTKLIETLKSDDDHYTVSSFETRGHAMEYARENDAANGGKYAFTDSWEKDPKSDNRQTMPHAVMSKVMSAVKAANVHEGARDAIANMIQNMYLQSLDEHSARTSSVKRKNRAGFDEDMMKSFLTNARSEAGFLAQLEHGPNVNDAFYRMQGQVRDSKSNKRENQDMFNALAAHYAANQDYVETPIQDNIMALTSAMQLATSIGYHVTNATQGFMVTLPKLASDFNDYQGAWRHLMDGYGILKFTGAKGNVSFDKVPNAQLRQMLTYAAENNLIDVGMTEDLTHFNRTRTGIAAVDTLTKAASSAMHKLRSVSRMVETTNRIAAAAAAFNMAKEKGQSVEQAQEYAIGVLRATQGDFTRMDAPLAFKKLPKFVMQYKKFQFMMAALYAKAYHQAFHGATAEEKAIGKRMLAYKLFHTGMAAGALGFPMVNLATIAFAYLPASLLGTEGEPPDMERYLREMIGDEDMATLLLHGPLAAVTGLDMSSKLGDDKIFSIAPYTTIDLTSSGAAAKTIVGLAGPSAAQAMKFAEGLGFMGRGDYYKGVEQFMPKGVADVMKATRIANEGFTLKNGDVMFTPDDVNGMAAVGQALGLPTSNIKHMEWVRGQQYEINDFYQKQTKAIQQDYARAVKDKDTEDMAASREDWQELQQGKAKLRQYFNNSPDFLKTSPLSQLLKYPNSQEARQRKLQQSTY